MDVKDQKKDSHDERLEKLMKRHEKEQQEFENHWVWKQLKTTPKEFFKQIRKSVKQSGLSETEWQTKLADAKQVIETRVKEKQGQMEQVNFKRFKGLRV